MGCGSSKSHGPGKPKDEPKQPPLPDVSMNAGTADEYSPAPNPKHLWTIRWEKATLKSSADIGSIAHGFLEGVTGKVYEGEVVACTFKSDAGQANKLTQKLELSGNVLVHSIDQKADLRCDKLTYDAQKKLFYADGNVSVSSDAGTIGTFTRIVATQDLKRYGTPELFQQP